MNMAFDNKDRDFPLLRYILGGVLFLSGNLMGKHPLTFCGILAYDGRGNVKNNVRNEIRLVF